MSLGEKTVKGVIWNYVSFASGKFLTFISTIILARLLVPEQFGLVALALLVIQYLDAIGDLGISAALVYQRDNLERAKNVAFIVSLLAGVFLAIVTALAAPAIANFYKEPDMIPMLQVLAITQIITALGQTHMSILTKDLNFRQKLIPDLARSLAKGLVSIVLALIGWGAWSLIWGQVAATVATTLVLFIIVKWRPKLEWDWNLAKDMLNYGGQIVLLQVISVVWSTADYIIVGNMLGRTDLAYYQQAFRVADLLIINIAFVVGRVLFPSYAKISDNMDLLRDSFRNTVRYISLVAVPLSVGIAAVGPMFVSLVFGPNWTAMTPALQLLAIRAGISTLSFNTGHLLKAIGKPDIINYQMVIKLVVLVVAVLVTVPYGFVAVAWSQVVVAVFNMVLEFATMVWLIKVSPMEIWREMQPAVLASTGMGLLVWLLSSNIPEAWYLLGIIGGGVLGVVAYVGLLWFTGRDIFLDSWQWIRRIMLKRRTAARQS